MMIIMIIIKIIAMIITIIIIIIVVKLEELSLAFYLSKKEEKLLNEGAKEGLFCETEDPKERKRQNTAERKKRFEEKVLHG